MSGITLAQAEANLAKWITASEAVSNSQSYAINGRSLTRANAGEIIKMIDYWQGWISKLSSAGSRSRVRYGVVL